MPAGAEAARRKGAGRVHQHRAGAATHTCAGGLARNCLRAMSTSWHHTSTLQLEVTLMHHIMLVKKLWEHLCTGYHHPSARYEPNPRVRTGPDNVIMLVSDGY